MGESLRGNRIFASSQSILQMYSVMGEGKYYFTAWKTGRYHLNQIITVNITRSRTYPRHILLTWGRDVHKHHFCGILDKNTNHQFNHEEIPDKPKLKNIPETHSWVLFKESRVWKTEKLLDWGVRWCEDQMSPGTSDWILAQKRDLRRKLMKFE